jgi:hypothetical protein
LATATRVGWKFGLVLVAGGGLVGALGWFGVLLVLAVVLTSPLARILLWTGRLRGLARPGLVRDQTTLVDDVDSAEAVGMASEGAAGAVSRRLVLLADLPDAGDMPALDDPGLCDAWRRSYVRLERSRGAARLAVVRLRELYLDELVRRHPAEVRQWLASGARAAGNPLPYLRRPVRPEKQDEWPDDRGSNAA